MRAAMIRKHGPAEVMEIVETPTPSPGPGQVLVKIHAAALNHIDLWLRNGLPALKVPLPHVAGGDAMGTVVALGKNARGVKEGDRVVLSPGTSCGRCRHCEAGRDNLCAAYKMLGEAGWGFEREYVALPAENAFAAPANVSDTDLAAIPTTFTTAYQMLVERAQVRRDETVLVMGAGAGVGVAGLQIAKLLGARVIAASSSDDKLAKARALGADEAVNYATGDLVADVRKLVGRGGVDVVFEHTGASTFPLAVRVAAKGGRIVTCGATDGYEPPLNLRYVFWRQLSILGSTMSAKNRLADVLELLAEGRLQAVVDRVLPFERIADAHRALESRKVFGKVVLTW